MRGFSCLHNVSGIQCRGDGGSDADSGLGAQTHHVIAECYDGKTPRAKHCTCKDSRFFTQVALPHAALCVTWTERRGTLPCGQLTLDGALLRRRFHGRRGS